jgi:hypothetical protein
MVPSATRGAFLKNPTAWGGICRAMTTYDATGDVSPPWAFFFAAPQVSLDPLKNFLIKNFNKKFLEVSEPFFKKVLTFFRQKNGN